MTQSQRTNRFGTGLVVGLIAGVSAGLPGCYQRMGREEVKDSIVERAKDLGIESIELSYMASLQDDPVDTAYFTGQAEALKAVSDSLKKEYGEQQDEK